LQSRFGGAVSSIYGLLKLARLYLGGIVSLKHANIPLLARWKEVASSGSPILILKAARRNTHANSQVRELANIKFVLELAGPGSRVLAKVIDGAHHSFGNYVGRTSVPQNIGSWLETSFPRRKNAEPEISTLCFSPASQNGSLSRSEGLTEAVPLDTSLP
jgi:hypothetical protein